LSTSEEDDYNVYVTELQLPNLAIAAKVIETLQRHPSRDEVELVVDLGLDSDDVHASIDALVHDGFVVERDEEGHRVYELAHDSADRSLADLLSNT
jgi:competence protein ComGC